MGSRSVLVLLLLCAVLLGENCEGNDRVRLVQARLAELLAEQASQPGVSLDDCFAVMSPVELARIPTVDDRLLVAAGGPSVIPLDVSVDPPVVASPGLVIPLPGGGTLDGVTALSPALALVPAMGPDRLLFADPATGAPVTGTVDDAAASEIVPPADVPLPTPAPLDSNGVLVTDDPMPLSVPTGAAVVLGDGEDSGRLFVAMSNPVMVGEPVHLPGTVLVYALPEDGELEVTGPPETIFTTRYNPTDLTVVARMGRTFVLVTQTGPVEISADGLRLTIPPGASMEGGESAIDVIEVLPDGKAQLVATIPLNMRAAGGGRLSIDPSGRFATVGSLIQKTVLAVDLSVLDDIPGATPGAPPDPVPEPMDLPSEDPVVPIPVADRLGGPLPDVCPGAVAGTAWTADGRLLALEFCDGTLTSWTVDVGIAGRLTVDDFVSSGTFNALASQLEAAADRLRSPRGLVVRPGTPGTDFDGPDVFFIALSPEGLVCGLRSDAL